jgi:hypothetical protein
MEEHNAKPPLRGTGYGHDEQTSKSRMFLDVLDFGCVDFLPLDEMLARD